MERNRWEANGSKNRLKKWVYKIETLEGKKKREDKGEKNIEKRRMGKRREVGGEWKRTKW